MEFKYLFVKKPGTPSMFDNIPLFGKKKEKEKVKTKEAPVVEKENHLPGCKCVDCVAKKTVKSKSRAKKKVEGEPAQNGTTEEEQQSSEKPDEKVESNAVEAIPVVVIENDISEKENKRRLEEQLAPEEVKFVKKLFGAWNKGKFWDKFWSIVALLLVIAMCYVIYEYFLRHAGTIPYTHLRFR